MNPEPGRSSLSGAGGPTRDRTDKQTDFWGTEEERKAES